MCDIVHTSKKQYKINEGVKAMSYFAIERNQKCMDHVVIRDNEGRVMFKNYFNMTYDEMKSSDDLEEFVVAVMDAANKSISSEHDQTLITLVGDDDVFIWSIIIGTEDSDGDIKYILVDWKKDGKSYRYEPENTS
jgi:hypothetical protein